MEIKVVVGHCPERGQTKRLSDTALKGALVRAAKVHEAVGLNWDAVRAEFADAVRADCDRIILEAWVEGKLVGTLLGTAFWGDTAVERELLPCEGDVWAIASSARRGLRVGEEMVKTFESIVAAQSFRGRGTVTLRADVHLDSAIPFWLRLGYVEDEVETRASTYTGGPPQKRVPYHYDRDSVPLVRDLWRGARRATRRPVPADQWHGHVLGVERLASGSYRGHIRRGPQRSRRRVSAKPTIREALVDRLALMGT